MLPEIGVEGLKSQDYSDLTPTIAMLQNSSRYYRGGMKFDFSAEEPELQVCTRI